jgi:hypothetical protein
LLNRRVAEVRVKSDEEKDTREIILRDIYMVCVYNQTPTKADMFLDYFAFAFGRY